MSIMEYFKNVLYTSKELLKSFKKGEKLEGEKRIAFLELCIKAAVCNLYEKYPNDVKMQFSLPELENISQSTQLFKECRIEEMFHKALFDK